jgi:hypothetical protein
MNPLWNQVRDAEAVCMAAIEQRQRGEQVDRLWETYGQVGQTISSNPKEPTSFKQKAAATIRKTT